MGAAPLLAAGAGILMGGIGMHRGGSKVGSAAESMAHQTDRTLKVLTSEVQRMREFAVKEAWPDINATLVQIRDTLEHVDDLLVKAWPEVNTTLVKLRGTLGYADDLLLTATHGLPIIVKAVAIPLLVATALLCLSSRSKIPHKSAERIIWIILYYVSLFLALLLMISLIGDVFAFERPGNKVTVYAIIIPVIFPAIIFQAIHEVWNTVKHYPEWLAELFTQTFIQRPICWVLSPILKGRRYHKPSFPCLYLLVFCFYCFLCGVVYCAVIVWSQVYLRELYSLKAVNSGSPWKTALTFYAIFFTMAFVIHLITLIFISAFVRPSWAYYARLNHIWRDKF